MAIKELDPQHELSLLIPCNKIVKKLETRYEQFLVCHLVSYYTSILLLDDVLQAFMTPCHLSSSAVPASPS